MMVNPQMGHRSESIVAIRVSLALKDYIELTQHSRATVIVIGLNIIDTG